jgi:MFS family permease
MADNSPPRDIGWPAERSPASDITPPAKPPVAGTSALGSTGSLTSRTFLGLLVAQFFAAFNDQAIHVSAMYFAMNTQTLTERAAITLMPILFYAPWALFCTVAGYFADRFSKRDSLVVWKVAEVGITGLALLGFWLGSHDYWIGPRLVLATVFLMGTHSAFFVPAKYGVMPEILSADQLSRGNGILESLSFLAVILGAVSGGVLSYYYLRDEVVIGQVLFGLAVLGAIASLLIRRMPAADPGRHFPRDVYGPLIANIKILIGTKALRTALIGIAFFTFVVAFMRASVYMLGESQNPRWDELKTSVVVGCVALGIGLGSPLAGWLSGRRIELRLVTVGAAGMIVACLAAGYFADYVPGLVVCIALIGFFTGFYIVPLFTLLQHKAPKTSKGEMIATSNFVNVTGAILASLLFFGVVFLTRITGLTPEVTDRPEVATGTLMKLELFRGRPVYFEVEQEPGQGTPGLRIFGDRPPDPPRRMTLAGMARRVFGPPRPRPVPGEPPPPRLPDPGMYTIVDVSKEAKEGTKVIVTRYDLADITHYDIRPVGSPLDPDYDQRGLPQYLFIGAAVMTFFILLVLWRPIRQLRQGEV